MKPLLPIAWLLALAILVSAPFSLAHGQDASDAGPLRLNLLDELQGLTPGLGAAGSREPVQFSAQFQVAEGSREGRLTVTADLGASWHVYSVTQPARGPQRSRLTVPAVEDYEVGPFTPNQPPRVRQLEYYDVPVEEHVEQVRWSAPIVLSEGVDPETLTIRVIFSGQVCQDEGQCIPISNREIAANFAGFSAAAPATGIFRGKDARVELQGRIEPATVRPGDTATLTLAARTDEKWYIYAHAQKDPDKVSKPTLIALTNLSGLKPSTTSVSEPPVEKESGLDDEPVLYYHDQPVAWTIQLQIPPQAEPGEYQIEGLIGYQTCTPTSCDQPAAASFVGSVLVSSESQEGQRPLAFSVSTYEMAREAAERYATVPKNGLTGTAPLGGRELAIAIGFGLLGGLLLNLMPCVLPVIGLKILSFVEQGGQSRGRVFMLNLWYSVGLVGVFVVLATLAAFLNLGWGEQFTHTWFKVAMTVLVFAMALSFLGIWEIPIPGFVGTGKSNELQQREGASGAFSKGVFTTILATPCSGPFLGPVFAYTLAQPPVVTYILFLSVGLGMASPYLLIGAYPGLMRFLPRPGMWMETFKQLMAFFLLGTVVYLFTTIKSDYFIATLSLLVGVWFACWWIGRTSITAEPSRRLANWASAVGAAVAIGWLSFTNLGPRPELIAWQPYSPTALQEAKASGRTVMVDFTAEWCPTCKWNLANAIDTRRVNELVEKHDVVPMIADWTDHSETIKQALNELNSNSIPLLAIYPAGRPEEVIVLRDLLREGQVMEALQQAALASTEGESTTAMTDAKLAY